MKRTIGALAVSAGVGAGVLTAATPGAAVDVIHRATR